MFTEQPHSIDLADTMTPKQPIVPFTTIVYSRAHVVQHNMQTSMRLASFPVPHPAIRHLQSTKSWVWDWERGYYESALLREIGPGVIVSAESETAIVLVTVRLGCNQGDLITTGQLLYAAVLTIG